MSDLIDRETGKWSYVSTCNPETQLLFEQIEDMIASGALPSARPSPQAIVDFDITRPELSVPSTRTLKRLLKEYRKQCDKNRLKNV